MLNGAGVATISEEGSSAAMPEIAPEARIAEVYTREHGRLAALGAFLTGDASAGEDLAHDVFVHALRRCQAQPSYLRDPAWPWLRTALVRRVIRRRERVARELTKLTLLVTRTDAPHDWSSETVDCLRAVASLPATMRACACLFYWQDLSTAQIAQILGLTERAVENQLRRARIKLTDRLRVTVPGEES